MIDMLNLQEKTERAAKRINLYAMLLFVLTNAVALLVYLWQGVAAAFWVVWSVLTAVIAAVAVIARKSTRLALGLVPVINWLFGETSGALRPASGEGSSEEEQALRRKIELLSNLEPERNRWRDMYMQEQAGHNAAQAMMLRQIAALQLALKKATGRIVPLDPTMLRVCEELGLHMSDIADDPAPKEETKPTEPASDLVSEDKRA